MVMPTLLTLFSVLFLPLIRSGSVPQGGICSTNNVLLDPTTHKFLSDCDDKTFCSGSGNGTCQLKQCRRDEFPFGFESTDVLPPLCSDGSYCPDEGSNCKPLIAPGEPCEMNRDEQCAPPPNVGTLLSHQNFNSSICLQSVCMYANITLGHQCIVDDITYVGEDTDGQQFGNSVTRHNCITPRFYCHLDALLCVQTNALGLGCTADQECKTYNCNANGVCVDPPEMPLQVAPWQYAITAITILTAMIMTIVMLTLVHKRLRLQRYREIMEYYEEQMSLRRSLVALHTAAADRNEDEQSLYDWKNKVW